jgi:hypothetical protein
VRRLLAAVLALMVASSSAKSDDCAQLRQQAAQYAARLINSMYENPKIDMAVIEHGRQQLDAHQRAIAKCLKQP